MSLSCGGSYALGGGGSGARATDRGATVIVAGPPAGSPQYTGRTAADALIATVAHDAISWHAPGDHGNEQSVRDGADECPPCDMSDIGISDVAGCAAGAFTAPQA